MRIASAASANRGSDDFGGGHRRSKGYPAPRYGSIRHKGRAPVKVLITGFGGFVASHAAAEFAAGGHEVFLTGRDPLSDSPPFPFRQANLIQREAWEELLAWAAPEAVLHLAGQSNPAWSWEHPGETMAINLGMACAAAEALRNAPSSNACRFLFVSSADVYGAAREQDLPLSEECTPRPTNPYAVSKLACERTLELMAGRFDLDIVIARPFSHTGPGQTAQFVVPAFARQAALVEAGRQDAVVHGDLSTWRDFTDVRDVVAAYRLLVERGTSGEVYNICSGESVSIRSILETLLELAGLQPPAREDTSLHRPEPRIRVRGNATRLKDATGWERRYTLRQTLEAVLEEQRTLARGEVRAT